MATDVEKLLVEISADMRQMRAQLDKGTAKVNAAARKMQRSFADAGAGMQASMGRVAGAVAAVGAAVAGLGIANKLVATNAEFQKLKATLETFLGTREKAEGAFNVIKTFAAQTPNSVAEVTQSFNRMLATGLNPTIRALNAFGNVAAGSGKTVIEFTEAVADAAVNEFERLKEFGIKASKQGDKVALTFKGVTKTVDATSAAITEALTRIGETEFGGAMARQAQTLTGAFSNMGDAVDNFLTRVGDAGLNDALVRLARTIGSVANANGGLADQFGAVLASGVDALPKIFEGIARTVLFVRDNMHMMVQVFYVWFGMKVAARVIEISKAMILYARALTLTKLAALAFGGAQRILKISMVAVIAILAKFTDKLDYVKRLFDDIVDMTRHDFVGALEYLDEALKGVGLDFSALTSDVSGFRTGVEEALPSIEHLDTLLLGVTGKAAAVKKVVAESKTELQKLAESTVDVGKALDQQAASGLKSLSAGLVRATRDSGTAGDAFRSMSARIVDSLLEMVIQMTVVQQAARGLQAVFGLAGGLFGGGGGAPAVSPVGPAKFSSLPGRAIGGPVLPGRAYQVGEMGREVFVPQTAGRIVPNNQISGDTINVNLSFSAGVAQEVQAQLRRVLPDVQQAVMTGLTDARRRGVKGLA